VLQSGNVLMYIYIFFVEFCLTQIRNIYIYIYIVVVVDFCLIDYRFTTIVFVVTKI
jgi:hypothetical protein